MNDQQDPYLAKRNELIDTTAKFVKGIYERHNNDDTWGTNRNRNQRYTVFQDHSHGKQNGIIRMYSYDQEADEHRHNEFSQSADDDVITHFEENAYEHGEHTGRFGFEIRGDGKFYLLGMQDCKPSVQETADPSTIDLLEKYIADSTDD